MRTTIEMCAATVAICPWCGNDMYVEQYDFGRLCAVECSDKHCHCRGPWSEVGATNALKLWHEKFPPE